MAADKMKWFKILMYAIGGFFLFLHIPDLIQVLSNSSNYPFHRQKFDTDFDATSIYSYSIYYSKEVYVAYTVLSIAAILAMFWTGITKRHQLFYVLVAINFLLVLFPILTVE